MSEGEIQSAVQKVADEINRDYQNREVILVCVLKGAYVFCADLIRKLNMDCRVEFVRLSSYGKSKVSSGTVTVIKDIDTDIKDKHVIIVEEIIDSGRTLRFLYDRLLTSRPASVEIVTLLDKYSKRVVEVSVKYIGRQVDDQFLIGYGLDLEEKCRNFSDIRYLKYPN
jgi:hypoxanthine phosphoribosyltransferase